MFYLDFLSRLHELLRPRTYLEIGVARGASLSVSRCRSIGIDPAFAVDHELLAPVSLVRATSEEFFDRLERAGAGPFGATPVDLAFIDGLHHFEAALDDFINVERHSSRSAVIVFDDIFPRDEDEGARAPREVNWTGDVFRIPAALAACRPDLQIMTVDTEPTGLLVVSDLDPASTVLAELRDELVRQTVRPDPQDVPAAVLAREGAVSPESAIRLDLWARLISSRS